MGPKAEGEVGCSSHMELHVAPSQQGRSVPGQKQGTLVSHRYGTAGDVDSVGPGFDCGDCDDLEVGADLVLVAWPWWCPKQLSMHMQPWRSKSPCLEHWLSHGHLFGHPQSRWGEVPGARIQICG